MDFQTCAKQLLQDYGYIHYKIMSDPRLVCKLPFSSYDDSRCPSKEFCAGYCCLWSKEWFEKIYNYRWGKDIQEDFLDYCPKQNNTQYILGVLDSDKNRIVIPFRDERVSQVTTKESRKQVVIDFWIFSYIYLGSEGRNEFIELFNPTTREYTKFAELESKFEQLFGQSIEFKDIQNYEEDNKNSWIEKLSNSTIGKIFHLNRRTDYKK